MAPRADPLVTIVPYVVAHFAVSWLCIKTGGKKPNLASRRRGGPVAGRSGSGAVRPQRICKRPRSTSSSFKGDSMKLIAGFDSNYRYILVAARRARQLQSGAPPVVETISRKPCRIAQDEIKAGKVKWLIPETRSATEQAAETIDKALGQD